MLELCSLEIWFNFYIFAISASQGSPKKAAGAWLQEKLLSVMSIGDNEKENKKKKIDKNEAAVVIQSRKFRFVYFTFFNIAFIKQNAIFYLDNF